MELEADLLGLDETFHGWHKRVFPKRRFEDFRLKLDGVVCSLSGYFLKLQLEGVLAALAGFLAGNIGLVIVWQGIGEYRGQNDSKESADCRKAAETLREWVLRIPELERRGEVKK